MEASTSYAELVQGNCNFVAVAMVVLGNFTHTTLITNPRNLHAVVHDLKKHLSITVISVNTQYRPRLDSPEFAGVNTHHPRVAFVGVMAVQRVAAERCKPATRMFFIESCGLTETSSDVIATPLNSPDRSGAIGKSFSATLVTISDEGGNKLLIGEVGEICVRGPQVMLGYWSRPDEAEKVFTAEGRLRTNDMRFMNERGYFKLTDRKKDMINVSVFTVFPNQIKDVVSQHPAVAEVAAIGVQEERFGEIVKIMAVKKEATPTSQELLAHCRKSLTEYEAPKLVEFRDEPRPKSNPDKILRRELRCSIESGLEPPCGRRK